MKAKPRPGRRVILVYPSTGQDVYGINTGLPLGLLMVGTVLEAKGYAPVIVDQRTEADFEGAVRRALAGGDVLFLGVSSMTGFQIRGGLTAARLAREHDPELPVVWGGVHPSLVPEGTVRHPLVDAVCAGEGEETVAELADALAAGRPLDGTPGVWVKAGDGVSAGPERPLIADLDTLPPVNYDLVDALRYFTIGHILREPQLQFVTSRGCTHRCGFCYNLLFNKGKYRAMSAGRVYAELKRIAERFGVRSLFLYDDYFFADRRRVLDILDLLEAGDEKFLFEVSCRVDFLDGSDETLLRRLRADGFQELLVGVESGNDEVLGVIGKRFTVAEVERANRKIGPAGLNAKYSFMAGFPGETDDQLFDTVDLMRRLLRDNPNVSTTPLSIYTPYPGTPLFDLCLAKGLSNFPSTLDEWADYDWVEARHSFLDKRRIKHLNRLNVMSRFFDRKAFERFGGRWMRLPVMAFYGLYHALIEWRLKHRRLGFMPEVALVNRLQRSYVDRLHRKMLGKGV